VSFEIIHASNVSDLISVVKSHLPVMSSVSDSKALAKVLLDSKSEFGLQNVLEQHLGSDVSPYGSCLSLRHIAASLFADLDTSAFKSSSKFRTLDHRGRVNIFLKCDADVRAISDLVLSAFKDLNQDALPGLNAEIHASILYALRDSEIPWDVGACLRTILLYLQEDSAHPDLRAFWDVARLGVMYGLKEFEMFHLQEVQKFSRKVFALEEDEAGHVTVGHQVVDERDIEEAKNTGSDLLFGELLVDGVSKCIDRLHMDANKASSLCDLGMGLGKLALQAWLMYPNSLKYVLGVELARTRYALGEAALLRMCEMYPEEYKIKFHEKIDPRKLKIAIEDSRGRILEFRKQDLFLVKDEGEKGGLTADIVITETHFPEETTLRLCKHLNGMKRGARLLTYENLHKCYGTKAVSIPMPFHQLSINVSEEDRFPTTWSTVRGHHFYLWRKLTDPHQNE